jgi:GPI mannosyltransferase 3
MSRRPLAVPPELAIVLAVAFLIRLGVFYLVPNVHWPDEIFQVLSPAHRLVFGTGAVSWEWVLGLRSWLLPGFMAGLMELGRLLGDRPVMIDLPIEIFMAAAGCAPVLCAYLWGRRFFDRAGAVVAASVPAIWVDLVYMSGHTLDEVLAADALVVALYLGLSGKGEPLSRRRLWIVGAILGLVFDLRFPLGPVLAVAAFAFCGWRDSYRRWLALIAGASIPVLALGVVDWVTLGVPFQSVSLNLWFNLEEGGAYAGRSPFDTLILLPFYLWGVGSLLMIFAALIGARRLPQLLIVAIVIIGTYSLVPHKEYRFIYPALILLPVLAGLGTADFLERARVAWPRGLFSATGIPAALSIAVWLMTSGAIAGSGIYRNAWTRERAQLLAFNYMSGEPGLCGVGLYGVWWVVTPGETGLPPFSRLYQSTRSGLVREAAAFNYLLTWGRTQVPDARYRRVACFNGDAGAGGKWQLRACVWRRPGACAPHAAPPLPVNWPSTITGKPELAMKFSWNGPHDK